MDTKKKDIWKKEVAPAKNVEAFIRGYPKEVQVKLRQFRRIIKTTASGAEEVISYKMPAYKLKGKFLVSFAGFKKHIGFYPMSGSFLETIKKEIKDYETSRGTIRFPLDKPLPSGLIKKIIRERIKMIEQNRR